jgi:4a-hydroxytetrahydrobiopterin dehydratase
MATTPLTENEINTGLAALSGWERNGDSITKTYKFDSYAAGLAFASAAGIVADGKDHHPDILIGWKKVTLTFTTHDAGNKLSQKDIDTAAAIEALGFPKAK